MELTRKALEELILKEITGRDMEAQEPDMTQAYIDYIVKVQELSREAIEAIENGAEPYDAIAATGLSNTIASYTDQEFYDHFHR